MAPVIEEDSSLRVLMLLPTLRDRELTATLLARAGLTPVGCSSLPDLAQQMLVGAGAVLFTEEVIAREGVNEILDILKNQPRWSDLPVILMMRGGAESTSAAHVVQSLRNVTLLEKPAPTRTVISAVQAAVRARLRQYEIRDRILAVEKAEKQLAIALSAERAARTEAERIGRMKDEFLATLSHELRTPLNAILGWSQLLRAGPSDAEELNDGLETIERNARAQTQLIEDLLDMSRIISGKILMRIQAVDPAGIVNAAVATVTPAAVSKGVRLVARLDRTRVEMWADPNRLQQIVWNLVSNAIKFTPQHGTVEVALQLTGAQAQIKVTDTGRGINADFLPHVFERFRQADSKTTRESGGLGLGLAIVKSLVELHGGSIRAESDGPRTGSTFTVTLPLGAESADESDGPLPRPTATIALKPAGPATADLAGIKVLVVDDEPDARNLACRILQQSSATVITAGSALEALLLLESDNPDVLVSDIGMPVTDGYELLKSIRSLGTARHRDIPAIALTAFARSEDRARALDAGYSAHIAKPVEAAELVAAVVSVTHQHVAG